MELPIGYKFRPTDQQLMFLLKHKTLGKSDHNTAISTHGSPFLDPTAIDWSPITYLDNSERFFFVKRQKMSNNGKRIKSSWESGSWRAATAPAEISDDRSQVCGYKIQLDFLSGPSKSPSQYLMHEYSLPNEDEWAVCRIKKGAKKSSTKVESPKRRRKEEDDAPLPIPAEVAETTMNDDFHNFLVEMIDFDN